MQAADTNIWARAYLDDDAHQARMARAAIDGACAGEGLFIPTIVLVELFWVLSQEWSSERVLETLRQIMATRGVVLESQVFAERALKGTQMGGAGFADRMILEMALSSGAREVITFDKVFARLPDVRRLHLKAMWSSPR